MALRYRRLREISRLLPLIHSGNCYTQCSSAGKLAALSIIPQVFAWERNGTRMTHSRFSTTSKVSYKSTQELDLLSFIKSSMDAPEGPCHCWLNRSKGDRDFLGKNRTFLVLAGWCESFLTTCESVMMLEKVKSLQQRYPQLHVMGFMSGSSVSLAAAQSNLIQYVVKENAKFPVILSDRTFPEMDNGACYILFKDFENPVFYPEKDLDIRTLNKAVEELHVQDDGRARSRDNLKSTWVKQFEVIKEPYVFPLKNLLFNFPGCVSADESGNRFFLSDSRHHRIIVFVGNGKILDCIGSSPGFEDGNFESAKMVCPASSFYDAAEDSLYFVDSENHAIRKADLGNRVVETLYPNDDTSKNSNSIWARIMIKLGLRRDDTRSEEFDIQSLMFPWHVMKSSEDSLFIINRSFETLWVLDFASREIKQVVKGFPKIMDVCGLEIMKKVSLLKQMPDDWLQQQTNAVCSPKRLPYAGLISSLTTLQNHVILCDMVGQRILKLSEESGLCSTFQFSNFGILGLPYWLASPLERVYAIGGHLDQIDHQECVSLLPGRIGIHLNVEIPVDTELVEQLQEGCIWRQARGAANEVLGAEDAGGSTEKVGAAQKWYDELDNLAFSLSTPESELNVEDNSATSDNGFQDAKVHIDCAVNTSPGTSEVIVYAALYLKLRKEELLENNQEKYAAKIADILSSERSGKMERDSFVQFLLKSNGDLRDLIFMKPLHVRVKLDCLDHPKAPNGKNIILTDSNIEINVSLSS
ncbi:uncharacterized protein LOC126782770 isoform X2 [Argentina anserina]|uniref:uncharacterized protein LOC126782770 isoform X2 n=1 Tax=Argentina anserina TaxID=57926 RepID=UPI002176514C|nr:uncharacterized protein LOC126782770 isoform X2 [Potentilla anserina]